MCQWWRHSRLRSAASPPNAGRKSQRKCVCATYVMDPRWKLPAGVARAAQQAERPARVVDDTALRRLVERDADRVGRSPRVVAEQKGRGARPHDLDVLE